MFKQKILVLGVWGTFFTLCIPIISFLSCIGKFDNFQICEVSWVDILQKEQDFVFGIFGVLLGRIFGFVWETHEIMKIFLDKQLTG